MTTQGEIRRAYGPLASQILGLKSFGCLVDPLLPPQWAPGAAHVHSQCLAWSPGRSIFRSFVRFDLKLNFGLALDPFWGRLGLLLAPFWEPKSDQLSSKMKLETVVSAPPKTTMFTKQQKNTCENRFFDHKMGPKIAPSSNENRCNVDAKID